MKRVAIMQPYFLPYLGYFQLLDTVDLFIVYDNIKYTKKGWINRNRMLHSGEAAVFSLSLKGASDSLDVCDRELAASFDRQRLLNQMAGAYRQAPYFAEVFPLLEKIVRHQDTNLFRYLHHSLVCMCEHLGIRTEIRVSSSIPMDHSLQKQDKVLALCAAVGATTYVNPIGGVPLYSAEQFRAQNVELRFIQPILQEYTQFDAAFVPALSIVDVLMFNPLQTVRSWVSAGYTLV
jgi:hypothetical protein